MKLLIILCTLCVLGCDSNEQRPGSVDMPVDRPEQRPENRPEDRPSNPTGTNERPENRPEVTTVDGHWGPSTGVGLRVPTAVVEPGRSRRRMNLDQLESAFLRVSDGLNWTERRNGQDVSLFATLSATLGKPDFIQVTSEVLEPTALFQKFLDDAARQVCLKMVQRDGEQTNENGRVLLRNRQSDDTVQDHLITLVRRFHNRVLDDQSNDLAQWRWFVDSLNHVAENDQQVWHAVCVALFTHPDFYTY